MTDQRTDSAHGFINILKLSQILHDMGTIFHCT